MPYERVTGNIVESGGMVCLTAVDLLDPGTVLEIQPEEYGRYMALEYQKRLRNVRYDMYYITKSLNQGQDIMI